MSRERGMEKGRGKGEAMGLARRISLTTERLWLQHSSTDT